MLRHIDQVVPGLLGLAFLFGTVVGILVFA